MTSGSRLKVSLSLPADLIARVDQEVKARSDSSRSAVVEEWLRKGAHLKAESDLRASVVAYYQSLDSTERREEEALSRALSQRAHSLRVDDPHARLTRGKKR
jgi:metal-responsive CopG/Arc/MetJ family transcriptional regulator